MDEIKLSLPENRTTAFKWEENASSTPHILQLKEDNYLASTYTLGGRGIHEWIFKVAKIRQKKFKVYT